MANTTQERVTGNTVIRVALAFLETRDTGCTRDAAGVTALAEIHARCVLKKKAKFTIQAPPDRTSNEMRGCHAESVMQNGNTAYSVDFDDAKCKGKAKDPTIYRANAHESNDDFGTSSEPPTAPQSYGGSIPRSPKLEPVLGSPSSATSCLHSKNVVNLPVNNNKVVMSINNTKTESATIPKEKPYAKDDTLNQAEATNMIYAQEGQLHFMSGSAASKLQTEETLKERYRLGSVCGHRDLRNRSLDLSFRTGQCETRHEFRRRQVQKPHLALPTDPSQTSLYSKTLSLITFPQYFLSISSTGLNIQEVVDSLLMARSRQSMPINPLHEIGNHGPGRTSQQIRHHCDALSNDDGLEGNGKNFQSPTYTGGNEMDTQRNTRSRIHYKLHGPRSCSASLCNHVDTLPAHVLQTRQTMTRKASLIISQGYGSYNMAQQQVLAAQNTGAEPSQAQDIPQNTADPSLEASNRSHEHFNGVLGEFLEGLTPSSVSRHASRKRSRQHTVRSRRTSSAPPSGSSKASSRAKQARIHGAAALSLLFRVLCFSHSQAGQTLAVAPESGSFWLQCHPISFPHHNNDTRYADDGEQEIKQSTPWLAIIDMEAMWQ